MTQLIDKSALVAEIDRRIADNKKDVERASHKNLEDYFEGYEDALTLFKEQFLKTLEVKDVDLDIECRKYLTEHFNMYEDGILQSKRSNLPLDTYDVIQLAKHFFELGIKAQKGR